MGCAHGQAGGKQPRLRTNYKEEVAPTDDEQTSETSLTRLPVEYPAGMKANLLERKWSITSMDSNSSLLSLDAVAAGHGGTSILKHVDKNAQAVPEFPRCIMKVYDETEAQRYEDLKESGDGLTRFTARFFGEVDPEDLPPDLDGRYMKLSNLLRKFKSHPHVMDCKLGVRSFGESEVSSTKMRTDLYERLVDLDPNAVTEEERAAGACTKFRWMDFNDTLTTMRSLGFRVDGIAHSGGQTTKKELKQLQNISDIVTCIMDHFLPVPAPAASKSKDGTAGGRMQSIAAGGWRLKAAASVLKQLREMRKVMHSSDFVKAHTFVGCSLLFVSEAQGPTAGVYLIDLAKTTPLPAGIAIDHMKTWEIGNHEDGLFVGMDNIIRCWEQVGVLVSGTSSVDLAY